ncbi:glutathione S-transferase [Litorivita pollutaquae]|uniref:Glutathione S-transferase n=1 Tax=Litorivita pollutaquae TaxID=2200892 RepID=A0A2V4MV46_9RHOB|nr:glutathione S-transferase family protein [Litorivita pollutaquae]OUS21728.1 glutathione S-transferase [Rhodobacterales bacterium 59_46_T64]PYC48168.1 glutathione S-transferase [Litorivita pollutaquae]
MTDTTLFGFDGSTYVRTVRCVLARKGVAYDQVSVNVLEGEPQQPEHLERHPFGKVPVLDIDGMRLRETDAIVRYLESRNPKAPMFPADAKVRAKADENAALINNYGYGAIIGFVAYHLFPDLVGGKNEEMRQSSIDQAKKLVNLVMENKGDAQFLAGDTPGFADYLLGPLVAYATMTEDGAIILSLDGVQNWWDKLSADAVFASTAPNLG